MTEVIGLTAEMYRAIVTIVDERVKEIRVTREDFNALKDVVQELAQAQARTGQWVHELVQAQARTEQRVDELAQAQARTEQQIEKLVEAQQNLAQQVGRLSDTIGFGLEDIAKVVLPGYLYRHFGIRLEGVLGEELNRHFFHINGTDVEINLYGEGERDGQRVVVLGEAKSRIYGNDVEKFTHNLAVMDHVLKGERERDILVVASYQR